jgi:hypothetical protein
MEELAVSSLEWASVQNSKQIAGLSGMYRVRISSGRGIPCRKIAKKSYYITGCLHENLKINTS